MFNVRIKRYLDTEQIQIFSQPLLSVDSEREDKRRVIRETGEIVPTNKRVIEDVFDVQKKVTFEGLEFETPTQVIGTYIHDDERNIERSVRRTKNKIYDIAKSNKWEWFFTLTFNPQKVDSFDYELTTDKLSQWLKNMRKKCPSMKYLVVPEQHESGRWHFHGLFANVENMVFVDSGHCDKKGRVIYNVGSYRLGFSTATKIESLERACSYIAKYTTQELCAVTKGHKRYWCSRNVVLPEIKDLLIEMGYEQLKEKYGSSECYSKEVFSEFIDVTYIEKPIYTTNTDFSKRYRQKKPYIV